MNTIDILIDTSIDKILGDGTHDCAIRIILIDKILDVRAHDCPIRIIEAKKSLKDMRTNKNMMIIAKDKHVPSDFERFCDRLGCQILILTGSPQMYILVIKKIADVL